MQKLSERDTSIVTKIRELLAEATISLGPTSPSPALDAQVLLEYATGIGRLKFISDPDQEVSEKVAASFRKVVERRAKHEPVAYITGVKEFYGAEFAVTPDVLIPRPETELLVEKVLEVLKAGEGCLRVLDLGTGSGCIAVTLAREMVSFGRAVGVVAVDKSERALFVAQRNAKRQEVTGHIKFLGSDWFSALDAQDDRFDVIVSNPPYIAEGDTNLSPSVKFEPELALFSGPDGLRDISIILEQGVAFLKPGGKILFETGDGQHEAIRGMVERRGMRFESYRDLAGLERVVGVSM